VIPSLAMGFHAENIVAVVEKALTKAAVTLGRDVKHIAVTNRPGLSGSLA
jgi:tRNA A37 threonylcarbamoyltransferase TsaD